MDGLISGKFDGLPQLSVPWQVPCRRETEKITVDKGTFHEYDRDLRSVNPIGFEGYGEKLQRLSKATGLRETEELLEKCCSKFRKSGEFTGGTETSQD